MSCPICGGADHFQIAVKNGYPLHRCNQCSGIFVHPAPSQQELDDFYNDYHKTSQYKDKIHSKIKRARKRIAALKFRAGDTFLDVGCNLGFATEAGRMLGLKAMGIDVDREAITRATQLFPEASFRCADIADLATERQRFDVIYCSEVIEHLTTPLALLTHIKTVMTDRGVLLLTTPDNGHFSLPASTEKLVAWNNFRPPEHLLYFNKKSLKILLERAGFRHIHFSFGFKPTLKVTVSP